MDVNCTDGPRPEAWDPCQGVQQRERVRTATECHRKVAIPRKVQFTK